MKIEILDEMVLPLDYYEKHRDYTQMFDGLKGDTREFKYTPSESATPIAFPKTGNRLLIDLGAEHRIEKIVYEDESGIDSLTLLIGNDPFEGMQVAANITTDLWRKTREQAINKTGRYLQLNLNNSLGRYPSEIEFFGEKTVIQSINTQQDLINREYPLVNTVPGLNGFFWDKPDWFGKFKFVRLWLDINWLYGNDPKDALKLSPAYGGGINLKEQIAAFKSKGIEVLPVVHKSPDWMLNKEVNKVLVHDHDAKPRTAKLTTPDDDPLTFAPIAKIYHDIAKQIQVSEIERENEPDKSWKGIEGYWTAFQNAAFQSATFDGHEGLIPNAGVKVGNPNIKAIMGGLVNIDVEYLKGMHLWFKHKRKDGKFASDAINVHHYCNDGKQGISPEQGQLKERLLKLVEYRNKYLPDLPIYLTEFGYDTNKSDQAVPEIAGYTKEQIQGHWIVRSLLEILSTGIDRAYYFMLCDENHETENDTNRFRKSGLITSQAAGYRPKQSAQIVDNFLGLFYNSNYRFSKDLSKDKVKCYSFEDGSNVMYFVWTDSQEKLLFDIPEENAPKNIPVSMVPQHIVIEKTKPIPDIVTSEFEIKGKFNKQTGEISFNIKDLLH